MTGCGASVSEWHCEEAAAGINAWNYNNHSRVITVFNCNLNNLIDHPLVSGFRNIQDFAITLSRLQYCLHHRIPLNFSFIQPLENLCPSYRRLLLPPSGNCKYFWLGGWLVIVNSSAIKFNMILFLQMNFAHYSTTSFLSIQMSRRDETILCYTLLTPTYNKRTEGMAICSRKRVKECHNFVAI